MMHGRLSSRPRAKPESRDPSIPERDFMCSGTWVPDRLAVLAVRDDSGVSFAFGTTAVMR